jgi:transcriptional regulator with XRE-family HTH domain
MRHHSESTEELDAFRWSVGQRIRRRRKAMGLTTIELATHIGCIPSMISMVETGRRSVRSAHLVRYATALDCSTDYLLGMTSTDNEQLVSLLQSALARLPQPDRNQLTLF